MEILFGSFNRHKAAEMLRILREKFGRQLTVKFPTEFTFVDEVEESGQTLEENALIKVQGYHFLTDMPTFSDDTGLEVEALGGSPGVYSARYADPSALTPPTDKANVAKLLEDMKGVENRRARFRTVIAWKNAQGQEKIFEGVLEGQITQAPKGKNGFGYDAVFIPKGSTMTLAEMTAAQKNSLSHRARALDNFIAELQKLV